MADLAPDINAGWILAHRPVLTQQQFDSLAVEFAHPGSLEALTSLMQFLIFGNAQVGKLAAATIHRILLACDPLSLAALDGRVRQMNYFANASGKDNNAVKLSLGFTGALGALSFHPSGFVREAAIHELVKVHTGDELPFLLIRANDWVPQVCRIAKEGFLERCVDVRAHWLVKNLPLIVRLQSQSREDHRELLQAVEACLNKPACRELLRLAIPATDRATRRSAFQILSKREPSETDWLYIALRGDDAVLRLWAARDLKLRLNSADSEALLLQLASDRSMPVRREALYGYVEKFPALAQSKVREFLLDVHPAIREAARYFLRGSGDTDFAECYRSAIAARSEKSLTAALAGLGETGTAADAALIEHFLTHPTVRVRRSAVQAWIRLASTTPADQFLPFLFDAAPSVARIAFQALLRKLPGLPPEKLWQALVEKNALPHTRLSLISLVRHLPWWDSAPLLVRSLAINETTRELALHQLTRWRTNAGRSTVRPTVKKLQMLQDALARNGQLLDEPSAHDIRWHIDSAQHS